MLGYSFLNGLNQSNAGFMIVSLKPFEERDDPSLSVTSIIGRIRGEVAAVSAATVIPFNLPPIIGLGIQRRVRVSASGSGGRQRRRSGGDDARADLPGQSAAGAGSVFSTFAANNPQLYIEVAREKAQALGVAVGDIFAALQASLGGSYVNDFNAVRPGLAGQHPGARPPTAPR